MSFVVETGQGLVNANAYCDVAFVDAYHADRGHIAWANITDPGDVKAMAAIVRATDYVDKRFGGRFRGQRNSQAQSLLWPRINAFDDDRFVLAEANQIPLQLKYAIAEYALRAILIGEIAPDPPLPVPPLDMGVSPPVYPPSGDIITGQVTSKSVTVGPISERTAYESATQVSNNQRNKVSTTTTVSAYNIPEYPAADMYLERLLNNNSKRRVTRG